MGQIQFYNGQILFRGGQIAMHPDCCCNDAYPCAFYCNDGTVPPSFDVRLNGDILNYNQSVHIPSGLRTLSNTSDCEYWYYYTGRQAVRLRLESDGYVYVSYLYAPGLPGNYTNTSVAYRLLNTIPMDCRSISGGPITYFACDGFNFSAPFPTIDINP